MDIKIINTKNRPLEYLIVGDLHLKKDNLDKSSNLFKIIEEKNLPVIWLGDQLDTKEIVRSTCLNLLYRYLKRSKLQHIMLVGNHDWHNLECEDHSLKPLESLNNVVIVDKPTQINGMYFLPYYHDLNKFDKAVKAGKSKILFIHQGLNGFDFGNGYIEENGYELDNIKNRYELIISGHFHKPQISKKFSYLGTPFSHNFGESNQDKFLGVLNVDELKLDLVKLDFPKHITKEVNVSMYKEFIRHISAKDHWRIFLCGTEKELLSVDKTDFPAHVRIIEKETDTKDSKEALVKESDSNSVKFEKWAKEVKQLDKEVIKLGLDLLGDDK